jgi:cytochrome c peroxidase
MKKKFNSKIYTAFILFLMIMIGCQRDNESSIDIKLSGLLNQVSNGKGINFFKLPDGKSFAEFPQDPNNPITADKVELGRLLFHETCIGITPKKIESSMTYSCASCHQVDAGFQAGVAQGIGEGGIGFGIHGEKRVVNTSYSHDLVDVQAIRSPTILNSAYQEVMLWNGQFGATGLNKGTNAFWTKDTPKEKNKLGFQGVETQAIAGQDVHRLKIDKDSLAFAPVYRTLFNLAYSHLPENQRISQINGGLAIAAYERTVVSNQAPFQKWLRGDNSAMSETEKEGAILFFGKAGCVKCHTGPALNEMNFYALGMNDLISGNYGVINSDVSKPEHKGRGGFTGKAEDMFKFKVPQLYNLKDVRFLGHGAQFLSVKEVLDYKNKGQATNKNVPASQLASEFVPLNLTNDEIEKLRVFIEQSLYDSHLKRFVPSGLPSGFCFPNNDVISRKDRGCQ